MNIWGLFVLTGFGVTASLATQKSCNDGPFSDSAEKNFTIRWSDSNVSVTGARDVPVYGAERLSSAPSLSAADLSSRFEYVVLMEDPDAPNPESPQKFPWKHWLKVNVPSQNLSDGGEQRLGYHGPSPPGSSSPHRYFVAVYQQPHHIAFNDLPADSKDYGTWDAKALLTKFGIKYHEPTVWTCFKATSNASDVKEIPVEEVPISEEEAMKGIEELAEENEEEAEEALAALKSEQDIQPHQQAPPPTTTAAA